MGFRKSETLRWKKAAQSSRCVFFTKETVYSKLCITLIDKDNKIFQIYILIRNWTFPRRLIGDILTWDNMHFTVLAGFFYLFPKDFKLFDVNVPYFFVKKSLLFRLVKQFLVCFKISEKAKFLKLPECSSFSLFVY
jgi:hypothetical protein